MVYLMYVCTRSYMCVYVRMCSLSNACLRVPKGVYGCLRVSIIESIPAVYETMCHLFCDSVCSLDFWLGMHAWGTFAV